MRARRTTRTAALRLAVAGLVAGLTLAACGGQSLQQQGDAAKANLVKASSVAMTLRLDDPAGDLLTAAQTAGKLTESQATALLGAVLSLQLASPDGTPLSAIAPDPQGGARAGLTAVNAALEVRTGSGALGKVRLVGGTLYASLGTKEIDRLLADNGGGRLADNLDGAPAELMQAYDDLAAGKWLKLPLAEYVGQLDGLLGGLGIEPTPAPSTSTGPDLQSLLDSISPHVSFRDLGASGSTRNIEVSVAVKDAVGALVALGGTAGGGAEVLKGVTGSLDGDLSSAPVKATLTLAGEHVTALRVPLAGIVDLDASSSDADRTKNRKLVGSSALVLEIDDSAGAVEVPSDVSSLDLGTVFSDLFSGFAGGLGGTSVPGSTGGVSGLTPGAGLGGLSGFDPATIAELEACLAAGTDYVSCDAQLGTRS